MSAVRSMILLVVSISWSCSCDRGIDLSGDGGGDGDASETGMDIADAEQEEDEESAPDIVEIPGEDMGPPRYWSKWLDSPDSWSSITIPTHDGGYLAAGSPGGMGLVKLDDRGNVTWSRKYHVRDNEGFISLVETPDGDFITMSPVSDEVPFPDVPYSDIWVMRLDNRGEIIWQKILGGPKMDYGMDMLLTREGHLFVCGSFVDPSVDDSDAWVLKLDSDGAVIWQKRYGGEEEDEACAILQAEDEGFWVLGSTRSYGEEGLEPWIMKLDDSGEIVQQKVFHGAFEFLAGGLAPSPDGGIIVSGTIKTEHFTPQDAVAIRLDGAGSIVWKKMYAAPGNDSTGMLRPAIDGGLIMAGNSSSFGEGIDGIILKLDLDGNIIWQRSYGTPGPDYIRSIRATQDGGYIIGASSFFFYHKTWIMKLDAQGLISEDCPTGLGEPMAFQVWEPDLIVAETAAAAVETDIIPVDTNAVPTDPGPVEFETQCVGW